MRCVANKQPLPRSFKGHRHAKGLIAEADIFPHPHGKLAAKLLIFDSRASFHRFWRSLRREPLERGCEGCVNSLSRTRQRFGGKGEPDGPAVFEGDRRYFCLIGLHKRGLSMEVISHEAVHAGFCYEKRVRRNLFGKACDFDEERIAYPAGAIAAAINRFVYSKGLYERVKAMPYKSKAQQRKFHAMEARGEISPATVKKFDRATKKKKGGFSGLPKKVKRIGKK
jgi:hypothetical protein